MLSDKHNTSPHFKALMRSYWRYVERHSVEIAARHEARQMERRPGRRRANREAQRRYRAKHGDIRNLCFPMPPDWTLGEKCIYCGATDNIEADHVIPLARGASHAAFNLVPACRHCNISKGAAPPLCWLRKRKQRVPTRVLEAVVAATYNGWGPWK